MKLYHTETQEDYDALMVELEAEECEWFSGRKPTEVTTYWKLDSSETCVKIDKKVIAYNEKGYYAMRYPSIPIIKYKAEVKDKVKIYHTETQADYDALMIKLEEQGCKWLSGRKPTETTKNWKRNSSESCVRVGKKMAMYDKKSYYTRYYPDTPITKYKAKADEKMKFTKENVLEVFKHWRDTSNGATGSFYSAINNLDDTPEKVVVPKCFDEWYKEIEARYPFPDSAEKFALWKLCQKGFGYFFERVSGEKIPFESELGTWLDNNTFLAIDAVLNGYIIEPEKLYYIPLPHLELSDGTKQVLSKRKGYKHYFANYPTESLQQQFTKEELEQVPEIYKSYATPVEEEEEYEF